MSVALEIAIAMHTYNMQIGWVVRARYEVKRSGFDLLAAAWACLKRNRRWLLIIVLKGNRLSASGLPVVVPLLSHAVRCGCLADPQSNLKRPLAKFGHILFALQFERANQCSGST